jgi:hypothetical protein
MKLIRVLTLFGVAIVPHLAFADVVQPSGLGETKAIYDYCSQIDPADAATFGKMWIYAANGAAGLTPTSDFNTIYNATISQLKALPRSTMVSGCHGGASQWLKVAQVRPTTGKVDRPSSRE